MASPNSIRELRIKVGTTHRTTFENGAASVWNAVDDTATKLRVIAFDDSGLTQEGISDDTMQTRMHAKDASIAGLRKGDLKFTIYAGAAYSNLAVPPELNIVRASMGGLQSATNARSTTVGAGSTTVNVTVGSASTYVVAGQAALIGVKGDGRGGGEAKPINAVASGSIGLAIACAGAPEEGDAIVFSDTAYLDEDATQQYMDTYAIGHATADHRQTIGGAATYAISGMAPGELPKIEITLMVTDHQYITAAGDKSTLTHATTPRGSDPPYDKGIGLVHVGDYGDSTRTIRKCGNLTFAPGVAYEEIPAPHGVNGVGGFQHMPGVPTAECTLLMDEDAGLIADFTSQTAKSLLFQLGHTAAGCCAIEIPKAYIDALPVPDSVGNLKGLKITIHGTEDFVASNDLRSSAVRIHWF